MITSYLLSQHTEAKRFGISILVFGWEGLNNFYNGLTSMSLHALLT